jgi:chromosome segregation ATPase
VVIRDKNQ